MKDFAKTWKASVKPSKQRKYQYNAPAHIRRKFLAVHLSKELRAKHGVRSLPVKKGDTVKILRGQFKGQTGKVDRTDLNSAKVFVVGAELIKMDGSKVMYPINTSNLMFTDIDLTDEKRKKAVERAAAKGKQEKKPKAPKKEAKAKPAAPAKKEAKKQEKPAQEATKQTTLNA